MVQTKDEVGKLGEYEDDESPSQRPAKEKNNGRVIGQMCRFVERKERLTIGSRKAAIPSST